MAFSRVAALFLDRLLPESWRDHPEAQRRGHVLIGAAFASSFSAGLLALTRASVEGFTHPVVRVVFIAAAVFLAVPLVLRWSRSFIWAGVVMVGTPAVTLTAMIFFERSLHSDGVLWMPVVPLVAMFFLGAKGAVTTAFLCALGIIIAAYQHASGAWPPFNGMLPARTAAATGILFFGAFVGWLWERTRLRAQEAIAAGEARARALLDGLPDTLLRVDPAGVIVDVQLPHEVTPLVPHDAVGHRLSDIFPQALAGHLRKQAMATQLEITMSRGAYRMASPVDHRDLTVEVSMAPLGDDVIVLMRDISELQRANQLKDEFLSTVSHELRTPLTSIIGSLRLLTSEVTAKFDIESQTLLTIATRNSERLLKLINDLLDMQKIAGGRLELASRRVELGEILAANIEADLPFAKLHRIDLQLEGPEEETWVEVDPDRLSQVISNLISNAVKHSPPGDVVYLRAKRRRNNVRIEVEDHGPGIPEAFRPYVFERFTQAVAGARTKKGGNAPSTGLGLAIARQLVELQGGTISFTSTSDEGTTFFVELPTSH